jgi:putative transcriptional regulator
MAKGTDLAGQFLIAMPGLEDPNFRQSVTLLCEHNAEGAMGVVVNRPAELSLGELAHHVGLKVARAEVARRPVYNGGPVRPEACVILHRPRGRWASTLPVGTGLGLTGSMDVLEAIAADAGPTEYLACLGYAGWGPGQLEEEVKANAWLTAPGDPAIMFELPHEARWRAAAAAIGVDIALLSGQAGQA